MDDSLSNNTPSVISISDSSGANTFETLFKLYHAKLLHIAKNYLSSEEDAEEIVQDVFVKLWKKKKTLEIHSNFNSYLFKMVRNACLDQLRKDKRKVKRWGQDAAIEQHINYLALSDEASSLIIEQELAAQIEAAIQLLPDKCKQVFIKSRVQGLAHKDISEELDISVKTVENHITRAIKHMKLHLQEFLHLF